MKIRQMSVDLLVPGDVIAPQDAGRAHTVLTVENIPDWALLKVTLRNEEGVIQTLRLPYELLVTVLRRAS